MAILDLDNLLGKPQNMVARVGVELEGAWKDVPEGAHVEPDGSVFRGSSIRLNPLYVGKVGEIPLGPTQVGGLSKLITKYYPDQVDHSCGMHVHMSFKTPTRYMFLMEESYQDTMIEYLTRWARDEGFDEGHFIWGRLRGESVFCQKKFWPDLQVQQPVKDHNQERKGHRYTIIHYCGRQNTIEVRVLPMMKAAPQAIRAVKLVLNITNACLILLGKNVRVRADGRFELPGDLLYQETDANEIPLTSSQRRAILARD